MISTAYERTSLTVTTNLACERWVEVLSNKRLTGASLDRLTRRRSRSPSGRPDRGSTPSTPTATAGSAFIWERTEDVVGEARGLALLQAPHDSRNDIPSELRNKLLQGDPRPGHFDRVVAPSCCWCSCTCGHPGFRRHACGLMSPPRYPASTCS